MIDLEVIFFNTFGIKYPCRFQYPEITDELYLELLCILLEHRNINKSCNANVLKRMILTQLMEIKESYNNSSNPEYQEARMDLIQQVLLLFMVG